MRSDRFAIVPRAHGGLGGIECGSKSTLAKKRKQNKATNLDSHVSGQDVNKLIALYDSPAWEVLDSFTIENVTDFDADESLSIASALRNALVLRNVHSLSHIQNAKSYGGGVGRRKRFYEQESLYCDELRPLKLKIRAKDVWMF